ncbi:MAG: hypothetical protein QNL92_02485 [Octadecabacter sp.]|jgi:hypothetical protein
MIRPLLLWFALFLAIVCVTWLLLSACAVRVFFWPGLVGYCEPETPAELDHNYDVLLMQQEQGDLLAEIRLLERALATQICESDSNQSATLNEDGIDENAWLRQDLTALEGCWELDGQDFIVRSVETNLTTSYNVWEICFDANGDGQQTLSAESGQTCEGGNRATFEGDEKLRISDLAPVQCSDDSIIFRRETVCSLTAEGRAECLSSQPDDPRGGQSNVRLRRKEI